MKFAREGTPFVLGLGVVTLVFGLLDWWWAGLVALVLTLAVAAFFRDPEREVPAADGLVVSPADGKVVSILDDVEAETRPGERYRRVSIFMSPANVHVNRTPVAGEILSIRHTPGKFLAAFTEGSSKENERNEVTIRDANGQIVIFTQIAGWMARRIVCHLVPGDRVERGQRFGLIMFGSRVDVYLPRQATLEVSVGDRVRAGSGVLGEIER